MIKPLTGVKTLNWDHFAPMFDESWHEWMKPIITSVPFAQDFAKLREMSKQHQVIPSSKSNNLFRVFREVPYKSMRVVVVGLSPYNTIVNGVEVADGLAMSCSNTGKEQPTLTQWYNEMERQFGTNIVREPDLSYLCKAGVLLYNYSLTTEKGNATSHIPIWEYFTERLFKTAISHSDVPIITLGREAAKVKEYVIPWQENYELKHPASASYSKTDWTSDDAFRKVKHSLDKKGIPFSWVLFQDKF